MHVWRANVILYYKDLQKYHPISDYMAKLPQERRQNIFLLTDDANAIDEAIEFYPNVNWFTSTVLDFVEQVVDGKIRFHSKVPDKKLSHY